MNEQVQINTDFDLESEYKADPLIPQANYLGSITGVSYNPENYGLTFIVTLADNGGYMSDGETPIDGGRVFKTVWFPRPGDETEMTSDGKKTKRQSKINMLKEFADKMELDMGTKEKLQAAIENGDWIGIPVVASVEISEYLGRQTNPVNKMVRRKD
jgi:hypothetical protein